MIYKAIGLMSGSSLDGLDIVFAHFHEQAGKWTVEIKTAACYDYTPEWKERLQNAARLSARDYCLLDTAYGHYLGRSVNRFIEENNLHLQTDLVASHGHTVFHLPEQQTTAQLGDGAAIAAETGVAVVSDLRNLDVAFGGQGAPIVPAGEKLLFPEYRLFLNIGGIANISLHQPGGITAFDVCPANRVLNELAAMLHRPYDAGGKLARGGVLQEELLEKLNALEYYGRPWPKSLDNAFGIATVLPLVNSYPISVQGRLHTYVKHIAIQVRRATEALLNDAKDVSEPRKLLATGGGAFNDFLVQCIREQLQPLGIEVVVPEALIVQYKEALIMALLGVLRWRENNTVPASVTGARRDSIGGALWMGQEG